MAPGCSNILMHPGGFLFKARWTNLWWRRYHTFSKNWDGQNVGFKEGDTLYYAIPGRSLDDAGIDHLKDDASDYDMMKSNQAKFLEVYIKHNENIVSAYPTCDDADRQVNTDEVLFMLQCT